MAKQSFLDLHSSSPIFQQIADEVERQILLGDLKEEDFLMSVREFASIHSINPNTVAKAYQILQNLNLVEFVRGKGLKVKKRKDAWIASRKEELIKEKILDLLQLASALKISSSELTKLIESLGRKK